MEASRHGNARFVCAMAGIALLVAGCATTQETRLARAQYGSYRAPQAGELTLDEQERAQALCPFGIPEQSPDWDHGFTEYVVRDGYALEHSGDQKIPLWVCERLEPSHLTGAFERKDKFMPDDALEGPRSELSDYKGSGYARGHHAPAADHAWDERLLAETFYLSNMSPQVGAFNSGIWSRLKDRVRDWALAGEPTWVITGSMLYDPAEEEPDTADGWIRYSTIGAGVTVPTHLFKIVVGRWMACRQIWPKTVLLAMVNSACASWPPGPHRASRSGSVASMMLSVI